MIRAFGNRREQRGQDLVEFALAIPLLLMLLLGIFEVARWLHSYLAVQYAAREAARYAVTGQPPMLITHGDDSCEEYGHPVTAAPYGLPAEYDMCRADWIKHVARQLAKHGLLTDDSQNDITKPYYLGVILRGSPIFGGAPISDHPGAARTKVEVTVVFNHPVTNPFMAAVFPTVRTVGRYQMVNEPWAGGGADVPPVVPPAPTLPPLDTDGDGWSDNDERDIHGTLPSNPDTDGDGIDEGPSGDPAPLDPCVPNSC